MRIEDIDANLFNGRAAIRDLRLSAQGRSLLTVPNLTVDIDWLPLFSRQVVLRSITIAGISLSIEQSEDGRLRVGGIILPPGGERTEVPAGQQWHVGVDRLQVFDTVIEYRLPDLDIETRLDELDLDGIKTWTTDPATLRLRRAINGADIRLDGQLPPLAQGFGYRGSVALDGLDAGWFSPVVAAAAGCLAVRLTLDTRLDVLQAPDQPLHMTQSGMLRAEALQFTQAEHGVEIESLQWDGDVDFTAAGTPVVTASAQARSANLAYDAAGVDYRLVRIVDVAADRISLQPGYDVSVSVSDLAVHELVLAQSAQEGAGALLTAGAVTLDSLQLTGGNSLPGKLQVSDVNASMQRDTGGRWQITRIIDSLPFARAGGRHANRRAVSPGSSSDYR